MQLLRAAKEAGVCAVLEGPALATALDAATIAHNRCKDRQGLGARTS